MKNSIYFIIISSTLFQIVFSCTSTVHLADRAIMLEKKEHEVLVYGGGQKAQVNYNYGGGFGYRYGISNDFTFGVEMDINHNTITPSWLTKNNYGHIAVQEKFSLVKDIFALKMIEGIYINNFFGEIVTNPVTNKKELLSHEYVIPYIESYFILTPEKQKNKSKFTTTYFLSSGVGYRQTSNQIPWRIGIGLSKDYKMKSSKYLFGFEAIYGAQWLQKKGGSAYLQVNIYFSLFNRKIKGKNHKNNTSLKLIDL